MYTAKDFTPLLGLPGFSDALLTNHFTLYQGYVTNTNKLVEMMKEKEVGTPEFAELHRRFGWEWNGMRLHELYFGNMARLGDLSTARRCIDVAIQINSAMARNAKVDPDLQGLYN